MDTKRENLIVNLSTAFAIKVIAFHLEIKRTGMNSMASQLFRAGTSIGANVREAQNAESKRDFIHKMKIAAKEADETEYWFDLCVESPLLPDPKGLRDEIVSIHKVLTKIISSAKKNTERYQAAKSGIN